MRRPGGTTRHTTKAAQTPPIPHFDTWRLMSGCRGRRAGAERQPCDAFRTTSCLAQLFVGGKTHAICNPERLQRHCVQPVSPFSSWFLALARRSFASRLVASPQRQSPNRFAEVTVPQLRPRPQPAKRGPNRLRKRLGAAKRNSGDVQTLRRACIRVVFVDPRGASRSCAKST